MIVETQNSVYYVDPVRKVWSREARTPGSGALRSEFGTFLSMGEVTIGKSLMLLCPPIKEGTNFRFINSSPVTAICSTSQNSDSASLTTPCTMSQES